MLGARVAFMCIWSQIDHGSLAPILGHACGLPRYCTVLKLLVRSRTCWRLPVYLDPILVGAAVSLVTILIVSRSGEVGASPNEPSRTALHVPHRPSWADQAAKRPLRCAGPEIPHCMGLQSVHSRTGSSFTLVPIRQATGQLDEWRLPRPGVESCCWRWCSGAWFRARRPRRPLVDSSRFYATAD